MGAPSKAVIEWGDRLSREALPVPERRLEQCRRLLGSRHVSLGRVAQVVSADAALSLRLLSQVNRVRRSNGREADVLSAEIAANLLGEHALRGHLESAPVLEKVIDNDQQRQAYLQHLDRARLAAQIAERTATARGERSSSDLYMIALLREAPRLAMCLAAPDTDSEFTQTLLHKPTSMAATAESLLGCRWSSLLHVLLMEKWSLPPAICAEDEWLLDANYRDIGPRLAGELARQGELHGWYHQNLRDCEEVLAEHIRGKMADAHSLIVRSLLDVSKASDWLASGMLVQALIHPVIEGVAEQPPLDKPVEPPKKIAPVIPTDQAAPVVERRGEINIAQPEDPAVERRRQAIKALKASVAQLQAQRELAEPSVSVVLRAVLHGAINGLGLSLAAVFVRQKSGDSLLCRAALGRGSDLLEGLNLPLGGKNLASMVFKQPALLHVEPANQARYRGLIPPMLRDRGWESDFVIASLHVTDRPLALLLVQGRSLRQPDVIRRLRKLHALANSALGGVARGHRQASAKAADSNSLKRASNQ